MGAKKKNQSKGSGFYWYMQKMVPELKRRGRTFSGMPEMVRVTRPGWQALSAAEREPYERMAREEKRKNKGLRPDTERLDNLGNIIATREKQEEEEKYKREHDKKRAKSTWPGGQELIFVKFYIISFEYMCEVEDPSVRNQYDYIPREIGLVEWCMEAGITKELHRFIFPGDIPLGFRYNANEQTAKHHIPSSDFEHDDFDWDVLYSQILNFINPNDELEEYPPLYCLSHQEKVDASCMNWLHSHAEQKSQREFPMLDRFYRLEDCIQDIFGHVGTSVSLTSIDDLTSTTTYDFEPGTRCKFHEEVGSSVCALGTVKKCVFSMADSLVEVYDFKLTAQHVPSTGDREQVRPYTLGPSRVPEPSARGGGQPPHPSLNPSRSYETGTFPSRDIRYKDGGDSASSRYEDDNDDDDDDDYDDEALADMLETQMGTWNPYSQQNTVNVHDDDDFPALGAAAGRPTPKPQAPKQNTGWAPTAPPPQQPRSGGGMTLQEAAEMRRQQEREVQRLNEVQDQIDASRSQPQPPSSMPRSLRPAFGSSFSSGSAPRPAFAAAGAGRGSMRPAFIPPSAAGVQQPPRNPGPAQGFGSRPERPQASTPSTPNSSMGARARAPAFIPPSGDTLVYKAPPSSSQPAQPLQPPGIGRGRGMRPVFIPPSQPQGPSTPQHPAPPTSMPRGYNQPSQPLQPQSPAFSLNSPSTRPQGIGRGRTTASRPPPGFGGSAD